MMQFELLGQATDHSLLRLQIFLTPTVNGTRHQRSILKEQLSLARRKTSTVTRFKSYVSKHVQSFLLLHVMRSGLWSRIGR